MVTKTDRILHYLPPTFRRRQDLARSPLQAIVDAVGQHLARGESSLVEVMRAHWVDHADRFAEEIEDLLRLAALYGLSPRPDEGVEEFREHLKRYVRTFLEGTVTVQGILRVTAEVLGLHILDRYADLDTWWTRSSTTGLTLPPVQDGVTTQHLRRDDAADLLLGLNLGVTSRMARGHPARPARIQSPVDLSHPVDLRQGFMLYLQADEFPSLDVTLTQGTGGDPQAVSLETIVTAINAQTEAAWGEAVASAVDGTLVVRSPQVGASGFLTVLDGETDGAERLLGLPPRTYWGQEGEPARFTSRRDLSRGVDLSDRDALQLRIDGGVPVVVHCDGADPAHTPPGEIVAAKKSAFEPMQIATPFGRFINLTAATAGTASEIALETPPSGDATDLILGIPPRRFYGADASPAAIVGQSDLSQGDTPPGRGINLMARRGLLVACDRRQPVEIDVQAALLARGADPAAASLSEVVAAINDAFPQVDIADHDGGHLVLRSPTVGANSHIEIFPLLQTRQRRFVTRAPIIDEAAQTLLGFVDRDARGQAATPARVGHPDAADSPPPDLSRGVDLQSDAYLRLAVDAHPAIEIYCAGQRPRATALEDVVMAINRATQAAWGQAIATAYQQRHLVLTSPTAGGESRIVLEPHQQDLDGLDALLGIAPGTVNGQDAPDVDSEPLPARVVGTRDLSGTVDLRTARILRLAVDGEPLVDVDCGLHAEALEAATLTAIVASINQVLGERETPSGDPHPIASSDGSHLILTSPTLGATSAITLDTHSAGDARSRLLGSAPDITVGTPAIAAALEGEVNLLTPADLSERSHLRLSIDNHPPVDIDVAGAAPTTTFPDEVVEILNRVYPGLATVTETNHLRLTSPTAGPGSRIAVLPLRHLDLIEYVPRPMARTVIAPPPPDAPPPPADIPWYRWTIDNTGAIATAATITLVAHRGTVGPALVNLTQGYRIRILRTLSAGAEVRFWQDEQGHLQAEITSPTGQVEPVDPAQIQAGPEGMQVWVPFADRCYLRDGRDTPPGLQLNNPLAPLGVQLWQRHREEAVVVTVVEHDLAQSAPTPVPPAASDTVRLVGRVRQSAAGGWQLVDPQDTAIAQLRSGIPIPDAYGDRAVVVQGAYAEGVVIVQAIAALFDVTLRAAGQPDTEETYQGVTIGEDPPLAPALRLQITQGATPSQRVTAEPFAKAEGLQLPLGRSEWLYRDCFGSRFNEANFDHADFAGRGCRDVGVFNASRFAHRPDSPTDELAEHEFAAVFAPASALGDTPTVTLTFAWQHYQPGTVQVDLPGDLPPRFGGRFNQARFSQAIATPGSTASGTTQHSPDLSQLQAEVYSGAVTEPPGDPQNLIRLIRQRSTLVMARRVPTVPLGYTALAIPFRKPAFLVKGNSERAAALYLSEAGFAGFIKIEAKEPGIWGNDIALSARLTGAATYDISIFYRGGCFESARQIVLGDPLSTLTQDLIKPGPIGLLQAKAAGIHISVSRDNAAPIPPID